MWSQPMVTGMCFHFLFWFDFFPSYPDFGHRSPSPAPQYDNFGRRVNTREYRYRKRLEDERHKLVEKAMKTIPNYHPPSDYRRPTKTQEKVYVPVNDYPEINFSMITNPLTPNHSSIVSVMSPCSTRADQSYLLGVFSSFLAKPWRLTLPVLFLKLQDH